MNCKKCGHQLENDAKFCTKCGEKVYYESETLKEIKSHFEFLGYSCEFGQNEPKQSVLISKHSNKPNIICSTGNPNFVFLSSTWNGLKEINNIEQYKCLNKLNTSSTLSTIIVNNDGDLSIHSCYVGDYSKNRFGEFFDLFLNDINKTIGNEEFKKLFMK